MLGAYAPASGIIGMILFLDIILAVILLFSWLVPRKSPFKIIFVIMRALIIAWFIYQALFVVSALVKDWKDAKKDTQRYFTLSKDTAYGDIIMPKGTHIEKLVRHEKAPKAPHNLKDLSKARFPHPIDINGLSVIAIAPMSFITFELTEAAIYVRGKPLHDYKNGDIQQTCPKGALIIMKRSYEEFMARDSEQPTYPKDFLPTTNNWAVDDCLKGSNAHPHLVPYWENEKLIRPEKNK